MNYVYLVTQREGGRTRYEQIYKSRKNGKIAIKMTIHWLKTKNKNFTIWDIEKEELDNEYIKIIFRYCMTGKNGYTHGEIKIERKYLYG